MVEIELTAHSSDYSQEDLDCTDVVEIAEESTSVVVNARFVSPSTQPLFSGPDSLPSDDIELMEEVVNERKDELDVFNEEVSSLLTDGYDAMIDEDGLCLLTSYNTYQEAYEEAVRVEESFSMLDGSVLLDIDGGASEEAIEQIEQRVQNR